MISGNAGGNDRGGAEAPREGGERAAHVVLARFGAMRWVGEFACKPTLEVPVGQPLVLQTERGTELGWRVGPCDPTCDRTAFLRQVRTYVEASGPDFCRPRAGRVLRAANESDVLEQNHLNAHIKEDVDFCAELAAELGLDMRVITAEHLLGGERIVFYFGAETRVDFRQLVRELAARYRTRIEMRQVGARDEARLVADYEVCGRECCCRNFLKKLRPVNMKMAKLQKSTLDPSKVSGRCGRLRCCLRYEHLGYEELAARLPRPNTRVETEFGPATVLECQILTQLVSVRTDDDRTVTIPLEEIKAFNLPPAPPRPTPTPDALRARAEPARPRDAQKNSADSGRSGDAANARPEHAGRGTRDHPRSRGPRRGPGAAADAGPRPSRPPGAAAPPGAPENNRVHRASGAAEGARPTPAGPAAPPGDLGSGGGQRRGARRRRRRGRRGGGGGPTGSAGRPEGGSAVGPPGAEPSAPTPPDDGPIG